MHGHSLDFQIDYWNRIGPTKPFAHPVNLARLQELLDPASRILDFGCGYGRVAGLLWSRGYVGDIARAARLAIE